MVEIPGEMRELSRKPWSWIVSRLYAWRLVAEVDPENDLCEYGCRVRDCRLDRWAHCENRLKHMELLKEAASSGDKLPAKS